VIVLTEKLIHSFRLEYKLKYKCGELTVKD